MLPTRLPPSAPVMGDRGTGTRLRWMAILVFVGMVSPRLLPVGAVALVVWAARTRLRERRQRQRVRQAATDDLPVAVALLQIAAAAGHGPRTAVALVGAFGWGSVAASLQRAALTLGEGVPLVDSLASAAAPEERTAGWQRLVELCERADDDGGRWAAGLDTFAHDLHRQRMAQVEERTGRLTVALLVPLVGCILPAFVAMAIVPVVGGALLELAG